MIDQLPEGKSIGWMQAPPQWIFTHTVRFVGIVRVVIQDGEGFILIKKGKALMYFFKHGRIELRGHAALDYFNSHPTIEFNLCRYTPEEFTQALKICEVEETDSAGEDEIGKEPAPAAPVRAIEVREDAGEQPVIQRVIQQVPGDEPVASPDVELSPPPSPTQATSPMVPAISIPIRPPTPETEHRMAETTPQPVTQKQVVPQPAILEEADIRIIGQIKKLNGIVAISVFNEERNILLMGDVEIEPLLKIARTMLATTTRITPHLDWGSFVHMTLQIPEGNVIIAPYHEYHLCILTTRTINIGHIRRILRDLQQTGPATG